MSKVLRRLWPLLVLAAAHAHAGDWLGPVSTVNEPLIAGRAVQLDAGGELLPWPFADSAASSYESHVLTQWELLHGLFGTMPYFHCCFQIDPASREPTPDRNWVNSTAYLRGMMIGFVERLYPYTGDERTFRYVQDFVDYEIVLVDDCSTDASDYRGWSARGSDYVEPHLVGEDGYAYVRLYEMTGKRKYLEAAIHFADQLVKNYRPGDAEHSPWPVRCLARDGRIEGSSMGPYSANVLGPISLFDELVRIGQGDVQAYRHTRAAAWQWLERYPLQDNVWVGYFEDVVPSFANMNSVIPLELARYVLLHPELDSQWRTHSRQLIDWVRDNARWPKYRVHGAFVTTEQGNGSNFCCNKPNQCCDSHTLRLAATEALYFARTRDWHMRDEAYRSLNWATYFQGLPADTHAPFGNQWWFNDEFTDGPRRLMDALWAVPEWAPADATHLLGSTAAITHIEYGQGRVRYSSFDAAAEDVLRLDFRPQIVRAGGQRLALVKDERATGYRYDAITGVIRIVRRGARRVEISGAGGNPPSSIVSFDDPHRPAGAPLEGEYPQGLIEWQAGSWRMSAPGGAFGSFHITMDGAQGQASLRFPEARVLVGIDAYNPGSRAIELRIRCTGGPLFQATLPPGRLQRLRTAWRAPCTRLQFDSGGASVVEFDNLVLAQASAASPAIVSKLGP